MNKSKPVSYIVIVCGLALFTGSILCLVAAIRTTGLDQYYWAFNFLVGLLAITALIASFTTKHDQSQPTPPSREIDQL